MERIDIIKAIVDSLIERISVDDDQDLVTVKRGAFIHTYGVASFTRLLAIKRGLNPEISMIAGYLHDLGRIVHKVNDQTKGMIGALEAERVLRKTCLFSEYEISLICSAVRAHTSKEAKGEPYEEVLKDADVLERFLNVINYTPDADVKIRLNLVLNELNIA